MKRIFNRLAPVFLLLLASCQEDVYVKPFPSAKHSLIYRGGNLVGLAFNGPDAPEIDASIGIERATDIATYYQTLEDYFDVGVASEITYYHNNDGWDPLPMLGEVNKETSYTHCMSTEMRDYHGEKYTYIEGNFAIIAHSKWSTWQPIPVNKYWAFDMTDESWSEKEAVFNKLFLDNYYYCSREVSNVMNLHYGFNENSHFYSSSDEQLRIDYENIEENRSMFVSTEYNGILPCYVYSKYIEQEQLSETITFFDYEVHESRPDLSTYINETDNPDIDVEEYFKSYRT